MDGIHDVGGVAGFGAVTVEPDEPAFHAEWERRTLRIFVAAAMAGVIPSGGAFRHSIERMEPAHYLGSSYYEHWLTGLATLLVEQGITTVDELRERAGGEFPLSNPDRGTPPRLRSERTTDARFAVGSKVRVREWHPAGHTRAPRFVQGRCGVVVRHDGPFNLPDVEAHSADRVPDHTYSVRFTTRELWGEGGTEHDVVHVDLWEHYLTAAPDAPR